MTDRIFKDLAEKALHATERQMKDALKDLQEGRAGVASHSMKTSLETLDRLEEVRKNCLDSGHEEWASRLGRLQDMVVVALESLHGEQIQSTEQSMKTIIQTIAQLRGQSLDPAASVDPQDAIKAQALELLREYRAAPKFSNDHAAIKRTVALEDRIDEFLASLAPSEPRMEKVRSKGKMRPK